MVLESLHQDTILINQTKEVLKKGIFRILFIQSQQYVWLFDQAACSFPDMWNKIPNAMANDGAFCISPKNQAMLAAVYNSRID